MKLFGFKEFDRSLQRLGDVVSAVKVLRRSARKAMAPVLEAAQDNVSVDSGGLRESLRLAVVAPKGGNVVLSIGIKVTKRKVKDEVDLGGGGDGGGLAGKIVSVQSSKKTHRALTVTWEVDGSHDWHFVEFGTNHQAANPFLVPALENNADLVLSILKKELGRDIDRALKKKGLV